MPTNSVPRNMAEATPAEGLEAVEGLAWLGRPPSARSNALYWLLTSAGRLAQRACGFQLRLEGWEHRPAAGSYILAIAAHRSWLDGPLIYLVFPREPRIWYLASGEATIRRRPWLSWVLRAMGGMLPVYRGGTDVAVHLESTTAILGAGAVLGLFPEGTRSGPPLELGRFRRGIGLIGLRTGAPIVPVVLAGSWELYRGRRIGVRVLPPVRALDLANLTAAPAPGSTEEMDAGRAVTEALRGLLDPHYRELAAWADDPPAHRRPWRWLTSLFP